MTQEDKLIIAKIIREETGCGFYEATTCFDKLIEAIKRRPSLTLDGHKELKFIWEDSKDNFNLR